MATSAHLACTLSIEGKFILADVSLHSLGRKYSWNVKLEVVAIDTSSNLAILQLPADMVEGLKFFKLGSGCRAGERIFSIGHPQVGTYGVRVSNVYCPDRSFF